MTNKKDHSCKGWQNALGDVLTEGCPRPEPALKHADFSGSRKVKPNGHNGGGLVC